ncbi:MAG TPA: fructosamine kinase family protein [Streptosporangiaceae bacterium]|nr:fructosamine kinase family protein [Streptosporangiaceae bacterium]
MADPDARACLEHATGVGVREFLAIGGGHGAVHYRAVLADGREFFVKAAPAGSADGGGALTAEATGLRWLGEAGVAMVPEVFFISKEILALPWLPQASADRAAAERFGRDLALLHAAGADSFGAPWPGHIASLPLPNDQAASWPAWYAAHRLLPYCRIGRDAGTLGSADVALIESVADRIADLAGPAEPPSRIHGDCWSGNVLWSGGQGWLIDPAAHGGHRETDLAMLALFGAPYLDRILAAYREVRPLAQGWRSRIPLHQLHPLLVHVCLFGSGYRAEAVAAARAALGAG